MKVTFYADVPEYAIEDMVIMATSRRFSDPASGYRRVSFEVDFPPEVLKEADMVASISNPRIESPHGGRAMTMGEIVEAEGGLPK